jgi:hypothetical protein
VSNTFHFDLPILSSHSASPDIIDLFSPRRSARFASTNSFSTRLFARSRLIAGFPFNDLLLGCDATGATILSGSEEMSGDVGCRAGSFPELFLPDRGVRFGQQHQTGIPHQEQQKYHVCALLILTQVSPPGREVKTTFR